MVIANSPTCTEYFSLLWEWDSGGRTRRQRNLHLHGGAWSPVWARSNLFCFVPLSRPGSITEFSTLTLGPSLWVRGVHCGGPSCGFKLPEGAGRMLAGSKRPVKRAMTTQSTVIVMHNVPHPGHLKFCKSKDSFRTARQYIPGEVLSYSV